MNTTTMNDEANEQAKTEIEQPVPGAYVPQPVDQPRDETSGKFKPSGKPKKPKRRTKQEEMQDAAQEVLDAVEEARSKVDELNAAISEAKDELEGAIETVTEKLETLRGLREDLYQGWFDNMNEGLQQSPTGQKLSELLEIDLEPSMPELPEEVEMDFDEVESAAQSIMDAEYPQGFGRD